MHGGDTEKQIYFYEHDFYVFSNFSSFKLLWKGYDWMTSEHAYHSEKFTDHPDLVEQLKQTRSAHDAFKFANANRDKYPSNWDDTKLGVMKKILHAKVLQHPYVKKKLLDSGDKTLIEDSWRDTYWGWGSEKNGENHLGKLWMEVRDEVRAAEG